MMCGLGHKSSWYVLNGADTIYHAAGAVGNGVFTEARNRMESNGDDQLWVIRS